MSNASESVKNGISATIIKSKMRGEKVIVERLEQDLRTVNELAAENAHLKECVAALSKQVNDLKNKLTLVQAKT